MGKNINFGGMVKANELRIGNWIMVAGTGEIHPAMVNIHNLKQLVEYPDFALATGIPLTHKILEACGFWSHMDGGYYLPEDPNDENNLMPKCGFILDDEMNYHYEDSYARRSIKIKSLHQLQNLFFSLVGQELEISFSEKTVK